MYTLYVHISPNNKKYFGITSWSVERRWGSSGEGYKTQQLFWRAIQKHGWNNFQHIILADNLSKEWACILEQDLIWKYESNNSKYGYNIYEGGNTGASGYHFKRSEEFKQKISKAMMGHSVSEETRRKIGKANSIALKGKLSSNIGRKASVETREKQSIAAKNRYKKFDHPMLGRHHSEESIQKIKEANIGRHFKHTDETKKKIGDKNRGRKLSDEHKDKIRTAHLGKIVSEETKNRMSNSHKAFYLLEENRNMAKKRAYKGWETRRAKINGCQ